MLFFLTLAGALAFGSLAFWGFWTGVLVLIGVLVGLTEKEHWGWATTLFAATFLGLGVTGVFNLFKYATSHPFALVETILIYVGIGILFGAFKWWRYCIKQRELYDEAKADFLKAKNVTELTPELRVEWTNKLKNATRYDRHYVVHSEAPQAKEHKEKIINWMYLWPFSLLGTFLSDFIVRLWENIYKWMGGVYDSISEAVWKSTVNDLASESDIALVNEKVEAERKAREEKLRVEEEERRNTRPSSWR